MSQNEFWTPKLDSFLLGVSLQTMLQEMLPAFCMNRRLQELQAALICSDDLPQVHPFQTRDLKEEVSAGQRLSCESNNLANEKVSQLEVLTSAQAVSI